MADTTIKRVRVLIDGKYYSLSYNGSKWTGTFQAPNRTSYNEPGGYFAAQLEITNIANVVGLQNYSKLNIVVLEKTPPTAEVFWPVNGMYTQNYDLQCIMRVHDESGGSGISPQNIHVLLDGEEVGFAYQGEDGGYEVYHRLGGIPDGLHTIEVYCVDNDGNTSERASSVFTLVTNRTLKLDWAPTDYLNAVDLTRIETTAELVELYLEYLCEYLTGTYRDWERIDIPTRSDIDRLRRNIDAMNIGLIPWKDIAFNDTIDYNQLNTWEWDLQIVLERLLKIESALVYSGEFYGGEV